jgi:hypothetical protein
LDGVLADLEWAGCTIAGGKSQFCFAGMRIVGFVCDINGRHPDTAKVIKILEWERCDDVSEARAFIGICVYYRIFVPEFAIVAAPIYKLFKRNVSFDWGKEQRFAMEELKKALTEAPALVTISYAEDAGLIILAVDSSGRGWGACLMQEVDGKRHPARYESGLWTEQEVRYDATKRECRGVLKALKKVRSYLYGVHFLLEVDVAVLAAQLNRSGTDLFSALITRWLAWVRLFDFDVRHVSDTKHSGLDGLLRRPRIESDNIDEQYEEDIDDFIDVELNAIRTVSVFPIFADDSDLLEGDYSEESWQTARFLTRFTRPPNLTAKEF